MASDLDAAEERCLEAEAWAHEISAWARARRGDPEGAEAEALVRMVTAIVKSIRLSMVAGDDADARGFLLEELDQLLARYRSPAGPTTTGDEDLADLPASRQSTLPPPPGYSAEEIWKDAPPSTRGRRP
jgi:hypothetical protein